jgi:hypothetical protein
MAVAIIANTGALTARERQLFIAVADLYVMTVYGLSRATFGQAAEEPKAVDEAKRKAAAMLAAKFPDLGIEAIEEGAEPPPGKGVLLN